MTESTEKELQGRRDLISAIRPQGAPLLLTPTDIEKYQSWHMCHTDHVMSAQKGHHLVFCPACQEKEGDFAKVRILHVGYETDPLKNFDALCFLTCFGCSFHEIVPISGISADEQVEVRKWNLQQAKIGGGAFGVPSLLSNAAAQAYQNGLASQQMAGYMPGNIMRYGHDIGQRIWKARDEYQQMVETQARQRRDAEHRRQMLLNLYGEENNIGPDVVKMLETIPDGEVKRGLIAKIAQKLGVSRG